MPTQSTLPAGRRYLDAPHSFGQPPKRPTTAGQHRPEWRGTSSEQVRNSMGPHAAVSNRWRTVRSSLEQAGDMLEHTWTNAEQCGAVWSDEE
eukprot:2585737-Alexandrium_andersonii.AAC.1